jgi:hypothetical protein
VRDADVPKRTAFDLAITLEAKAWRAGRRSTTRLLARHAREYGRAKRLSGSVAIISHDEKPRYACDCDHCPRFAAPTGVHATFVREHEAKRHGTVSLDLVSAKVHGGSRMGIAAANPSDVAYPARTAIKAPNHGSWLWGLLFETAPFPSCGTFAPPPSKHSSITSSPQRIILTAITLFVPGPA